MIRPIVKDPMFLKQISENANQGDVQVMTDLRDTLNGHKEHCVG